MEARTRLTLLVCSVVFLAAGLYGRSLGFAFTGTDDTTLIEDQGTRLQDLSYIVAAFGQPMVTDAVYYRPLVTATLVLDSQWQGSGNAFAFHLTNLFCHIAAALLLFALLRSLALERPTAWAGTLLFVVHPALCQTVAWIPGRYDSLLAVFSLAALIALVRMGDRPRRSLLAGHLCLWGLALLCKETAVLVPVAGILLLWSRRAWSAMRWPALWIGWLGIAGAWALTRSAVLGDVDPMALRSHGVALRDGLVPLMHLGKLLAPLDLAVLADREETSWVPGLLGLVFLGGVARLLQGERRRLFLWGGACFFLFLAPTLLASERLVLETRAYLPACCLLVALVAAVSRLREAWPRARRLVAAVAIAAGVGFFVGSWSYSAAYADPKAFSLAAVAASPTLPNAHLKLGIAYHFEGDLPRAERAYRTAAELAPAGQSLQLLHYNLALIHMQWERLGAAAEAIQKELAAFPNSVDANYLLGVILWRQDRKEEAVAVFRRVLALDPQPGMRGEWSKLIADWERGESRGRRPRP